MKLARKLTIGLALGILAVMSVNAYIRVHRVLWLFEAERSQDERLLGRVLRASAEALWRSEGEERAVALVSRANDAISDVQFRWVWLDVRDEVDGTVLSAERAEALMRGEASVRITNDDRAYYYIPVSHDSGRPAALEVSESLDLQQDYVRESIIQSVAATVGVTAVSGLIAMGLGVFFVGRPVRRLYEQTRRIGRGDFSQRVSITQRDEIGELAREINMMCDQLVAANARANQETESRIAMLEQLRHADRLKTVGQLASGVAHELGTPLNVVSGHARLISKDPESRNSVLNSSRVIAEQADRMTAIIRQLLDFARRRNPKLETWDMSVIARDVLAMLSPLAHKRSVNLRITGGSQRCLARVDRFQAQQVITNLAMNALQAVEPAGNVEIDISAPVPDVRPKMEKGGGRFVRVQVRDDGGGIPEAAVPHVFEPFFTTKGVGEGTGLGLSVAYGIVQEHGGWIDVETQRGRGTTFSVHFQAAPEVEQSGGAA